MNLTVQMWSFEHAGLLFHVMPQRSVQLKSCCLYYLSSSIINHQTFAESAWLVLVDTEGIWSSSFLFKIIYFIDIDKLELYTFIDIKWN